MTKRLKSLVLSMLLLMPGAVLPVCAQETPIKISGRYPHLAMFNSNGECGTGAVVPWAGSLWVITYAPHAVHGSNDKLYEIDTNLKQTIRPESVGGTPANRMIHKESNQLNIGAYFIDKDRNVRAISPGKMPGRLTATARHLTDPANKLYIFDMEGMLYDVDVKSLAVTRLFARAAEGAHGKGAYTGQGRLVVGNNGEKIENKAKPAAADEPGTKDAERAGALAEFDGKTWRLEERRQFTDVTGPGGIYGSPDDNSPIWALGWDRRSVMLKLLDGGEWTTFRLPIADYSYVATHGWHTEWPRIREVGGGKFLMNMHATWFDFPKTFSAKNTAGIRPIGTFLKITGDFCDWNNQLVFGCDDAALADFRAGMKNNPHVGQSQSNLWFTTWAGLSETGKAEGTGSVWLSDTVKAKTASAPFLFSGYDHRVLHLSHGSDGPVTFKIETDANGLGAWTTYDSITVPARGYAYHVFPTGTSGEWVRLTADRDCQGVSATFQYRSAKPVVSDPKMFESLSPIADKGEWSSGTLRATGGGKGTLVFEPTIHAAGGAKAVDALEVGPTMQFKPAGEVSPMPEDRPQVDVSADAASIVVVEGKTRVRLPRSSEAFDKAPSDLLPVTREVVTERSLLNAGGSFYVLPRPNSGGVGRIKPVCTHEKKIAELASWRGLLVLAGCRSDASPDGHFYKPENGPGLWFGDVDDLWKMGKPRGMGGPWLDTAVQANQASDPYLMSGYDKKTMILSHDSTVTVTMTVEVDPAADGQWKTFQTFEVPVGKSVTYEFPVGYSAHWVRVKSSAACKATAQLKYE